MLGEQRVLQSGTQRALNHDIAITACQTACHRACPDDHPSRSRHSARPTCASSPLCSMTAWYSANCCCSLSMPRPVCALAVSTAGCQLCRRCGTGSRVRSAGRGKVQAEQAGLQHVQLCVSQPWTSKAGAQSASPATCTAAHPHQLPPAPHLPVEVHGGLERSGCTRGCCTGCSICLVDHHNVSHLCHTPLDDLCGVDSASQFVEGCCCAHCAVPDRANDKATAVARVPSVLPCSGNANAAAPGIASQRPAAAPCMHSVNSQPAAAAASPAAHRRPQAAAPAQTHLLGLEQLFRIVRLPRSQRAPARRPGRRR